MLFYILQKLCPRQYQKRYSHMKNVEKHFYRDSFLRLLETIIFIGSYDNIIQRRKVCNDYEVRIKRRIINFYTYLNGKSVIFGILLPGVGV